MPATAIGLFFIGAALLAFAGLLAYGAWRTGKDNYDLLDIEVQHWHDVDEFYNPASALIEDQWVGDVTDPDARGLFQIAPELFDQDESA